MYRTNFIGESRFEGELTNDEPNFTIGCPSGVKAGTLLVMNVRLQSSTATAFFQHNDWEMVSEEYSLLPNGNATRRVSQTLIHYITQDEADALDQDPGSVQWTFTRPPATGVGTGRVVCSVIAVEPILSDVVVATGNSVGSAYGGHTIPAVEDWTFTVVASACEMTAGNDPSPVYTTISGWEELPDGVLNYVNPSTGSRTLLRVIYREEDGATSSGTPDMSWVGTSVAPYTWGATIRWQPTTNGNGVVAAVVQPLTLPKAGYTITQMERDIADGKPVYWAHRGGSVNVPWGEMTLEGYRNAVYHGAVALEISCHRSQDGVWIMSHDNWLTRVTGESLEIVNTDSSEMLGLPVIVPGAAGVIGRLEDVLDEFGHLVLIVDNKPGSYADEFFNLLKTVPDWQDHIIVKIDGQRPIAHSAGLQAAQAAGFKTCAYWYHDSTMSGDQSVENKMEYTDYPGLEWDADEKAGSGQLDWPTLLDLAGGKPAWSHILTSSNQVEVSLSRGAKILQCAAVLDLVPQQIPGAYSLPVTNYQLDRRQSQIIAQVGTYVDAAVDSAKLDAIATATNAARDYDAYGDVFDAANITAPPFDVPSAYWSNDETTSSYFNPVEYLPAVLDNGTPVTGWDGKTSPVQSDFRLHAGVYETAQGANGDYMLRGSLKPEGDSQFCHWPIVVEFVTSPGVSSFEVTTFSVVSQSPIVMEVGGQYAGTYYPPAGMANGRKVRFDFEGPSQRWIRLHILGEVGFRAIRVDDGEYISLPSYTVTRRVAIIGDSWVHGAGSPVAAGTLRGTSPVDTYVWRLAKAMGAQEIVQAGIGGTGFLAGMNGSNPANYITRVSTVLGMSPDVLVFHGSVNDPYDGSPSYGTEAEIYNDMKQAVLDVLTATDSVSERYVLTIPRDGYSAANTAIRDAVAEHGNGVVLIDVEGLFHGTGNAVDGGTGTRGLFFLEDDVHASYNGHLYLARQVFRRIYPHMP